MVMCFFFSFIPATIWLILGYFIMFSSTKTDGAMRTFGRILAIWTFVIAACIPIMAAYVTLNGLCPLTEILKNLQSAAVG
jgi:hypothetical protein